MQRFPQVDVVPHAIPSHLDVAWNVRTGIADVGMGVLPPAPLPSDLEVIPLGRLEQLFAEWSALPTIIESEGTEFIKHLVMLGRGVAVLPSTAVRQEIAVGKLCLIHVAPARFFAADWRQLAQTRWSTWRPAGVP